MISKDKGRAKYIVKALNLGKANFRLLKELADGNLWEASLRDKEAEQSWQLFEGIILY